MPTIVQIIRIRSVVPGIAVSLFLLYVFFNFDQATAAEFRSPNKSECINCHSNLKKLVRLCWEVEKIKPKPKHSAETSGEG